MTHSVTAAGVCGVCREVWPCLSERRLMVKRTHSRTKDKTGLTGHGKRRRTKVVMSEHVQDTRKTSADERALSWFDGAGKRK